MNLDLKGRRVLVCGASRGIGRAVARELAELGAHVVLLARDHKALEEARAGLAIRSGQEHAYLVADLAETESLRATVGDFVTSTGPIHVLVNNAGGPPVGPAHLADVEVYLHAFREHLLACHTLAQILAPGMKRSGYGRIINIISTSVKEPIPGLGVSNTVRGAVASWAKTLAAELGPDGITVNNVLPGYTRTERLAHFFESRAREKKKPLAEVEAEARVSVPLGRFANPEEIAHVVAFLASPAASYIHGVSLPVDGGLIASL